jgi:hypothetical protein
VGALQTGPAGGALDIETLLFTWSFLQLVWVSGALGAKRGSITAQELQEADVVLTTYSTLENDFRRCVMPAKVACRWGRGGGTLLLGSEAGVLSYSNFNLIFFNLYLDYMAYCADLPATVFVCLCVQLLLQKVPALQAERAPALFLWP